MITLSKALKIKNRLLGEYKKLQDLARANNARRVDVGSTSVDLNSVWNELIILNSKIVELKSKVAVATAPIAPYLIDLAETKAMISFLSSLPVKEGNEDTSIGYGSSASIKSVTWESHLNEAHRNDLIKKQQSHLDSLQDRIDEFNAITKIDFS
jgi:hypothetical protein